MTACQTPGCGHAKVEHPIRADGARPCTDFDGFYGCPCTRYTNASETVSEECAGRWNCTLPSGHNMGQVDIPENHSPANCRERAVCDAEAAFLGYEPDQPFDHGTAAIKMDAFIAGYLAGKGINHD